MNTAPDLQQEDGRAGLVSAPCYSREKGPVGVGGGKNLWLMMKKITHVIRAYLRKKVLPWRRRRTAGRLCSWPKPTLLIVLDLIRPGGEEVTNARAGQCCPHHHADSQGGGRGKDPAWDWVRTIISSSHSAPGTRPASWPYCYRNTPACCWPMCRNLPTGDW